MAKAITAPTVREVINPDGSRDVYITNIVGQSYASETDRYDANGVLRTVFRLHASGTLDYNYALRADGTTSTTHYDFNGRMLDNIIGAPDGTTTTTVYKNGHEVVSETVKFPAGSPEIKHEKFYTNWLLTREVMVHQDHSRDVFLSNITGKSYVAEHDTYDANGTLRHAERTHADGTLDYTYNLAQDGTKTSAVYYTDGLVKTESVVKADGTTIKKTFTDLQYISDGTTGFYGQGLSSETIKYPPGSADISSTFTATSYGPAGSYGRKNVVHSDGSRTVTKEDATHLEIDQYDATNHLDLVSKQTFTPGHIDEKIYVYDSGITVKPTLGYFNFTSLIVGSDKGGDTFDLRDLHFDSDLRLNKLINVADTTHQLDKILLSAADLDPSMLASHLTSGNHGADAVLHLSNNRTITITGHTVQDVLSHTDIFQFL